MARRASFGEILGALLRGVPLWQTVGMLDGYRPKDDSWADRGGEQELGE
jgi:hypothetical protein